VAIQKVFDYKEVTLEYRSNGPATFTLNTDMPGGSMASRVVATLPSSGGIGANRTQTIALDGVQGTMYQVLITPGAATQFIPLAGKLMLRPIGVYLDGSLTPAEQWITQPIAPGV